MEAISGKNRSPVENLKSTYSRKCHYTNVESVYMVMCVHMSAAFAQMSMWVCESIMHNGVCGMADWGTLLRMTHRMTQSQQWCPAEVRSSFILKNLARRWEYTQCDASQSQGDIPTHSFTPRGNFESAMDWAISQWEKKTSYCLCNMEIFP